MRRRHSQQRLLVMRLAASGQLTAAQIAEQVGVSRRQFFNWVNALKAGGVEQLLGRGHGGGRPAPVAGKAPWRAYKPAWKADAGSAPRTFKRGWPSSIKPNSA